MFDIEIAFEDIEISSVQKEDVTDIQNWMQEQMSKNAEIVWTNIEELGDRFLEYYMSENEFFLKIVKDKKIIGILKGRVEFKNPNEVLIWCYILDTELRGKGIGSRILFEVINYFENDLGIYDFSTSIIDGSKGAERFWMKNKFELHRISKSFFNVEGEEKDMLLYKRKKNMKVI